jgi:hypothetical protein
MLIEPSVRMQRPNDIIPIYDGEFFLRNAAVKISIVGKIEFEWFPLPRAYFSGYSQITSDALMDFVNANNSHDLVINELSIGKCLAITIKEKYIKGTFNHKVVMGDKSIPVEYVKFSIPNFREFRGMPVNVVHSPTSMSSYFNRLSFESGDYSIVIDMLHNYKELNDALNSTGGFVILYGGEIRKKKGSIAYAEIEELTYAFSTFISFLNGKRTSLFFLKGIFEDQEVWFDCTQTHVDGIKNVTTWPVRLSIEGLNEMWVKFFTMWKDENNKDFLLSAIHWYVVSNVGSAFFDGSIIMAQTALELVYNWLIIENKKLLLGKDAESISAANKIRLILAQLKIDRAIPDAFNELSKFLNEKENKELNDGAGAMVQIRNALIHSQEDKRKKLNLISHEVKSQVLILSIWYIELSLLYILDFNSYYHNRCSEKPFAFEAGELVPWV